MVQSGQPVLCTRGEGSGLPFSWNNLATAQQEPGVYDLLASHCKHLLNSLHPHS